MPGSTPVFGWPFPLPTDPIAQGAGVIGNQVQAAEAQVVLPPDSRNASNGVENYPLGISLMSITTANAAAGGWPIASSAILLTARRPDGIAALQFWIQNVTGSPQIRFRIINNTGMSGWDTVAGRPVPDAMASNQITLTPPSGGGTVTGAVVFPSGRFTAAPRLALAVMSTLPQNVSASATVPTNSGFTMYLYRPSNVGTSIHWLAVQMDI